MTCANLGPFCDGELSTSDAGAFRAHLPGCEACQHGLEDWMQIAAHASDALPRFEAAKLERIKDAIAGLGKDKDAPAGWQGRVMDAVAWQERVRQVVRDEVNGSYAGVANKPSPQLVDVIAARVASQLASAAPVLSAEDLAALQTVRDEIANEWNVEIWPGANDSKLWQGVRRGVALLDRLLGASR